MNKIQQRLNIVVCLKLNNVHTDKFQVNFLGIGKFTIYTYMQVSIYFEFLHE